MNQKYTEIMMEMYTPDIWEDIGISEGFDIYSKDENGKKIPDLDKIKARIKEIEAISDVDSKAVQSKQLLVMLLGLVPMIASAGVLYVNPFVGAVLLVAGMFTTYGGPFLIKGNKISDFNMIANKIDHAAVKINAQAKKTNDKELKDKAEKLSKLASECKKKAEDQAKK